jgi:hypothetical protein
MRHSCEADANSDKDRASGGDEAFDYHTRPALGL